MNNIFSLRLGASSILLTLAASHLVNPGSTHAVNYAYQPASVTETNDLSALLDDDVDVLGGAVQLENALQPGDTVTWNYTYTKGGPAYTVINNDPADIEEFRIYGSTLGENPAGTAAFRFMTCEEGVHGFTPAINWTISSFGANNVLVSNEDNKLGNLANKIIEGFEITFAMTAGNFNFSRIDFLWEVDDIEAAACEAPVPEPGVSLLLMAVLLLSPTRMRHLR